jgi:EAL domain-containing protein (putative c-di-GMP-specific phosphodiesterase class I)
MLLEALFAPGALTTLFQPIVTLDAFDTTYAVECLTRGPADTNLHRADVLFDYVRAKHAVERVDRLCVATALASVPAALPARVAVSLNLHAATIAGHDLAAFVLAAASLHGVDTNRIVIEIVEHEPALDQRAFREAVAALRAAGVRFAIDDFGNGHSNLRRAMEVAPELIKLDRRIIDGCSTDARRRSAIGLVCRFAEEYGASVIAEGVETADDVRALRDHGVPLAQGWYFAKPMTADQVLQTVQGETHVA